jgi:hypothetical protein
MLAIQD